MSDATPQVEEIQDAVQLMRDQGRSPELAAFLAWLVPGLGHLYARHLIKGGVSLVLVLGLHLWGLALSRGHAVSLDSTRGHPYAFVAQVGAGGPTLLALAYSKDKLPGLPNPKMTDGDYREAEYVALLPDIDTGLLFTMVAGLLNVLLVYDAMRGVPGAIIRRSEDRRLRRRLLALKDELAAEGATPAASDAQPDAADAQPDAADAEDAQPDAAAGAQPDAAADAQPDAAEAKPTVEGA